MKNPFRTNHPNTGLIAGLAIGVMATGGLAYLYLQKKSALKASADELKERAQNYLKAKTAKMKKHKSDVEELDHLITAQ